jgi:Spy/CpxP family protein refolding chaperone
MYRDRVGAFVDANQHRHLAQAENEYVAIEGADMRKRLRLTAIALGLAAAGSVMAQGYGPGYGPGNAYGPGMMGGGYGPGVVGGGYGPGMMGGGYGPGMMGGYGRGVMGYGPLDALDMKDDQRDKIFVLQEEARTKNFGTMTQMRAEQYKLAKMYNAEHADPKLIGEQQKKVDELRRQMIQSHVETRNQVEALLSPEQKKQLRQYGPWWMPDTE